MLDAAGITWRLAGDLRFLPFLGRAFLLQVAHPTVSAGVAEHSIFESDPWGRLFGSFGKVIETIYGPEGELAGRRVREAHRSIGGVTPDGATYHAYEPEAYFWILATGADSLCEMAARTERSLTREQKAGLYAETRELGRRFGLSDRDMPDDLAAFEAWYAEMLASRIVRTETVERVLAAYARPKPPPGVPSPAWRPFGPAAGRAIVAISVGTLPAAVRDRLGVTWSRGRQAELGALCGGLRAAGVLPAAVRYLPAARAGFARGRP